MVWAEIWKISEFLSENFQFLVVKISIYLNRRVFVMILCLRTVHGLITLPSLASTLAFNSISVWLKIIKTNICFLRNYDSDSLVSFYYLYLISWSDDLASVLAFKLSFWIFNSYHILSSNDIHVFYNRDSDKVPTAKTDWRRLLVS